MNAREDLDNTSTKITKRAAKTALDALARGHSPAFPEDDFVDFVQEYVSARILVALWTLLERGETYLTWSEEQGEFLFGKPRS